MTRTNYVKNLYLLKNPSIIEEIQKDIHIIVLYNKNPRYFIKYQFSWKSN